MDATASVIAIVDLAAKVAIYCIDVREASDNIKKLASEVGACSQLVLNLHNNVGIDETGLEWAAKVKTLTASNGPIPRLKEALSAVAKILEPKDGVADIQRAIFWPFKQKAVEKLLLTIEREKATLTLALIENSHDLTVHVQQRASQNFKLLEEVLQLVKDAAAEDQRTRHELSDLRRSHSRMADTVETIQNNQTEDQRQHLLQSLAPGDYESKQADLREAHCEGTGQWFLETSEFKSWVAEPGSTLLGLGMPGAGKTMIVSTVIEELQKRFKQDAKTAVAFVFCESCHENEQNGKEQDRRNLLASLLKQLTSKCSSIPQDLLDLRQQTSGEGHLQSTLLTKFLRLVASEFDRVFIVVDALDEYYVNNRDLVKFLADMSSLQAQLSLNCLATSRRIPEIELLVRETFTGSTYWVDIQASDSDVGKYIDGRMAEMPRFVRNKPDLQVMIKQHVMTAVQGMFLLARLHLNALVDSEFLSERALRLKVQQLPTGSNAYDVAYEDAMLRIENQTPQHRNIAIRLLTWLVFTKRNLTLGEVQHALSMEAGLEDIDAESLISVDDVLSRCLGLVSKHVSNGISTYNQVTYLGLVHFTATEFFQKRRTALFPEGEHILAETCIAYLSLPPVAQHCRSFQDVLEKPETYALYEYACRYWGHHCREAPTSTQLAVAFLDSKASCRAWWQFYHYSYIASVPIRWELHDPLETDYTWCKAHFAALFGLDEVMKSLSLTDIDTRNRRGSNPLSVASARGWESTVQWLLNQPGVDPKQPDAIGNAPLWYAAAVDVYSRPDLGGNRHAAIAQLLLLCKVDINAKNVLGETALHVACRGGHRDVLGVLLEGEAVDVNAEDSSGNTPLHLACDCNYEEAALMLLDKKARPGPVNEHGETPLLLAASRGYALTISTLLGCPDIDVNSANQREGNTPLATAAQEGHKLVVELLCENPSTKLDLANNDGLTPVMLAAEGNHVQIVELLLAKGADVLGVDKMKFNLLHYLMQCEDCPQHIFNKVLQQHVPARLHQTNRYYMTPMHYAGKSGSVENVRLLGAHIPVDIPVPRNSGGAAWTLLPLNKLEKDQGVSLPGNGSPDEDPDLETHRSSGLTPLHLAMFWGNSAVVQCLLDMGANPNAKTFYGETALHMPMLRCLNVFSMTSFRREAWTPDFPAPLFTTENGEPEEQFQYSRGNFDIFLELLKHPDLDLDAQDANGDTVMHKLPYYEWHCWKLLRGLLERGANPSLANSRKQLPLHIACLNCALMDGPLSFSPPASRRAVLGLVKCRETRGEDRAAADIDGRNALHYAAEGGDVEIINLILLLGLDPLSRDVNGLTALHLASTRWNVEAVTALLSTGIDPNLVDTNGWTALHYAAALEPFGSSRKRHQSNPPGNFVRTIEVLLNAGADPLLVDRAGRTALQRSIEERHHVPFDKLFGNDHSAYYHAVYRLIQVSIGPDSRASVADTSEGETNSHNATAASSNRLDDKAFEELVRIVQSHT